MAELQTRQALAGVLESAKIYKAVASETMHKGSILKGSLQLRNDVEADMRDLVFSKLTAMGDKQYFDLDKALDSSVMGWARQLMRSSRLSIMRNIANRTINKEALVDPVPPLNTSDQNLTKVYLDFHGAAARNEPGEDGALRQMQDAADWLAKKARFQRGNARIANQAAAIRSAYSLPDTIRPLYDERRRLQEVLKADPEAALRSVKTMCALISREHCDTECDQGLLALWDDYSFDHLDTIAHLPEEVAGSLALAAVSDRPRMPKPVLRTFRASVRALDPSREWRSLSEELCEVFTALEFEAFSPFDTTGADFHEHKVVGRRLSILKSQSTFKRVLEFEGQRMGRDFDEVYAHLDRLVRELTDVEVSVDDRSTRAA